MGSLSSTLLFQHRNSPHASRPQAVASPGSRAGLCVLPFLIEQTSFLKKGPACGKVRVTLGAFPAESLVGSPSGRMAELVVSGRTRNEPVLHLTKVA